MCPALPLTWHSCCASPPRCGLTCSLAALWTRLFCAAPSCSVSCIPHVCNLLQVLAQGAPSNADMLQLWQNLALPGSHAHSGPPTRRGSRLGRLLSGGSRAGGGSSSRHGARLARWLSGSRAGRSLSWLLRLPSAGEGGAELAGPPGQGGRLMMELAGDRLDLTGLTLVLSAANQAAGGELSPPEVVAAAQAVMQR